MPKNDSSGERNCTERIAPQTRSKVVYDGNQQPIDTACNDLINIPRSNFSL